MRMFVRPLALVLLIPALAAAQNWPGYRWPTGQGHAESKDLPAEWSEDKNVAWKVPINGKGTEITCLSFNRFVKWTNASQMALFRRRAPGAGRLD